MQTRTTTTIYLLLKGASSLFVAMVYTVELIYQAKTVGLNPFQLVLAGVVNQTVLFLFEAPTGALADMYSRRWAVIMGLCSIGVGFLIEGGIATFAAVLVAQALWGLGASLMDGASAAWVADELGTAQAGPLYLQATQIGWLCTLPGIALSAVLGSARLNLPIVVGGGGYVALALFAALFMPERQFTPALWENRTSWQQMRHTIRTSIKLIQFHPILLGILGIGALWGLSFEGFGRLWQYHLLHTFTFPPLGRFAPIVWFGIIETGIALTNILGIAIARRWITTTSHRSVTWGLFLVDGTSLTCVILFAVAGQFALALAALWLLTTASGPHGTLTQAWMNQHLDASVRATVFSLSGQVSALAAISGGLLIGIIATAFTPRAALIISGIILVPALLLYARAIHRDVPPIAAIASETEHTAPLP